MYQVKIFEENNRGPTEFENRINSFFDENIDIKIIDIKLGIETVTGIDYKAILIFYEKNKFNGYT